MRSASDPGEMLQLVGRLETYMHLGQDVWSEGLWDLVEVDCSASGLDALLLGFGQGLDVAVHGVLWFRVSWVELQTPIVLG